MIGAKAGSFSIISFRCNPNVLEAGQWFWADDRKGLIGMRAALKSSIRQLILQAYCAFNIFEKKTISIMFICGPFFSLFRFTRPENLRPLPDGVAEPGPSSKKRKLDDQFAEYRNTLTKLSTVKDTTNSQLSYMIPIDCVEVAYHAVPVFVDLRARHVHLSDGFRQALRECLDGIDLQPCSLFDLQAAQFPREDMSLKLVCPLGGPSVTFIDSLI